MEKRLQALELPLQIGSPVRKYQSKLTSFRTKALRLSKKVGSPKQNKTLNLTAKTLLHRFTKQPKRHRDANSPLNTSRIKRILSKEKKTPLNKMEESVKYSRNKKVPIKSAVTNKTGSTVKQTTKDHESKSSFRGRDVNMFNKSYSSNNLAGKQKRDCFKHFYSIRKVHSKLKSEGTTIVKKSRLSSLEKAKKAIQKNRDKILKIIGKS